jgi:hypothetical protein
MRTKTNSLLIILTFAFGIMLASTIAAASVVVFAQQKNQTKTGAYSSSGKSTNLLAFLLSMALLYEDNLSS